MIIARIVSGLLVAVVASAAHAEVAVVLNSGYGSISLVDTVAMQETKRFPVGKEPHHLMAALDDQYLIVATRVLQSFAHANVRLAIGVAGERILVGPRYHRLHHAIGAGHEGAKRGCKFAVLLPIWDIIFRSADFNAKYHPTGIRDQLEGHDYGEGLWRQQRLGLKRLIAALTIRFI